MSETTETTAQREARLQRDAFEAGVDWHARIFGVAVSRLEWNSAALRRYPDPPTLTVRKAECCGATARWDGDVLRVSQGVGAPFSIRVDLIDMAVDLRSWPFVDQSGRACRQEPDGRVVYKEGA